MHLSREYAEALGIDFDAGTLKADAPKARPVAVAPAPQPAVRALVIPGRMPPTLNRLTRGKIRDRIRLGKEWRAVVREAAAGMAPATGKVRVSVAVLLPKGRAAADPDSLFKAMGDSLVAAGLLRDDSGEWVEWGRVEFVRDFGRLCTVVVLEDIDG